MENTKHELITALLTCVLTGLLIYWYQKNIFSGSASVVDLTMYFVFVIVTYMISKKFSKWALTKNFS